MEPQWARKNIFMSALETEIINKSSKKPLEWKRYIDDVFSLWDTKREEIKLTTEISEMETNFLDTAAFKGEIFNKDHVFDIKTHFKLTETFQYTHFSSCHARRAKKGFIKCEALRLSRTIFLKSRLRVRG